MKPLLTAITAAIFASSLAIPAFAQVGASDAEGAASSSTTTSSRSESTRSDGGSSVQHSERAYSSDRTDKIGGSVAPEEKVERHVEKKESTSTTSGEVPAPMTEHSSTTTRHEETERTNLP